ncbi:hypothetical protein L2E82_37213 [Cichorium intybus]|uniref:Uncharacterized protein n=1 Tax=Cichorium intybus TaxID=13427 RepID=A0ACB9AE37_CICIN|nr:hypothetical protein L2E82_37213 [Cichorium intybus]
MEQLAAFIKGCHIHHSVDKGDEGYEETIQLSDHGDEGVSFTGVLLCCEPPVKNLPTDEHESVLESSSTLLRHCLRSTIAPSRSLQTLCSGGGTRLLPPQTAASLFHSYHHLSLKIFLKRFYGRSSVGRNIVSTVNLDCNLDLKAIALQAHNAENNPKRFAAVIMRIREPRTTALICASGKMIIFQVLFIAGIDTTSSTLEWAMAELIRNPDKMVMTRSKFDWKLDGNIRAQDMDMEEKFGLTLPRKLPLITIPIKL